MQSAHSRLHRHPHLQGVDPGSILVLTYTKKMALHTCRDLPHSQLHLNLQGVDPGSILVLTYTKKMALEFRRRLVREVPGAERARVSTVHAFCFDVLRRHYRWAGG